MLVIDARASFFRQVSTDDNDLRALVEHAGLGDSAVDDDVDFAQGKGVLSGARGRKFEDGGGRNGRGNGRGCESFFEARGVDSASAKPVDEFLADARTSCEDVSGGDLGKFAVEKPLVELC